MRLLMFLARNFGAGETALRGTKDVCRGLGSEGRSVGRGGEREDDGLEQNRPDQNEADKVLVFAQPPHAEFLAVRHEVCQSVHGPQCLTGIGRVLV
jgi:hypothetical protein